MENYEEVKIELIMFENMEIITSSPDEEGEGV